MICHKHRWIFVHIQKTGGDSIRAALGVELNDPHKHRTAPELRAIYGAAIWQSSYKFAFVRNPWDRLVSWWIMIDALRPRFEAGEVFNVFQTYVLSRAKTFEDFLTRCDEEVADVDGSKHIFRNQIDYLTDQTRHVIVDFVGRFETLQDDMSKVGAQIGVGEIMLPRVNASDRGHYSHYYTEALADLVADRYRKDLVAFGYRF